MEDFDTEYARIDQQIVRDYLSGLTEPCYEASLLRLLFPEIQISMLDPLELYRSHFLLFHLLYQLQEEYAAGGDYLHIHFMRTFLVAYPPAGCCRFFEPALMQFCRTPLAADGQYCERHGDQLGEQALGELSARYFYHDKRNYYRLNAQTARDFMQGTWEYLSHYAEIERCFTVLGLKPTQDLGRIKRHFRTLALRHHPDLQQQPAEDFIEINNAYRILMKFLPLMQYRTDPEEGQGSGAVDR